MLAFIWNGRPSALPSSFRPICMTSKIGKLFEIVIKVRIEKEMENRSMRGSMVSEAAGRG